MLTFAIAIIASLLFSQALADVSAVGPGSAPPLLTAGPGLPQDPFEVLVGVNTVRFLNFEQPTFHKNDVLDFGFAIFLDLYQTRQKSHHSPNDAISNGVYRYASHNDSPSLRFSFYEDQSAHRPLTFRDMHDVLDALRNFAQKWGPAGRVPMVDIVLITGDVNPPAREGWGTLSAA